MASATAERQVIQIPVEPGLVCLRGLSPKRLRFEVEYGLERGTTANSFLFMPSSEEAEQIGSAAALLVHPLAPPSQSPTSSSSGPWCPAAANCR